MDTASFLLNLIILADGWIFLDRSYQKSGLYRDLKLRGNIVVSGQLKLLEKEKLCSTVGGIWNLSSDQGNLGTFIITNIRVIWYADINEIFNISLPYIQIKDVSQTNKRESVKKTIRHIKRIICR